MKSNKPSKEQNKKTEIIIRIKGKNVDLVKNIASAIKEIEKECNGHCILFEIEF